MQIPQANETESVVRKAVAWETSSSSREKKIAGQLPRRQRRCLRQELIFVMSRSKWCQGCIIARIYYKLAIFNMLLVVLSYNI